MFIYLYFFLFQYYDQSRSNKIRPSWAKFSLGWWWNDSILTGYSQSLMIIFVINWTFDAWNRLWNNINILVCFKHGLEGMLPCFRVKRERGPKCRRNFLGCHIFIRLYIWYGGSKWVLITLYEVSSPTCIFDGNI